MTDHELKANFVASASATTSMQERVITAAAQAILALPPCGHGASAEAVAALQANHDARKILAVLEAVARVNADDYQRRKLELHAQAAGRRPLEAPKVFTPGAPVEPRPVTSIDDGAETPGDDNDPFYQAPVKTNKISIDDLEKILEDPNKNVKINPDGTVTEIPLDDNDENSCGN